MPKRTVAAVLGLYTVVVASGAPLPLTWAAKSDVPKVDSAERFPCESSPCGCTADRCWTQCCCHTMAQRLAWARREGVRPPEEAIEQARRAGHDVSDWAPGLRVQPASAAVVEVEISPDKELPACCRRRLAEKQQAACSESDTQKPAPMPLGFSVLQALACQGAIDVWMSLSEAPTPPAVDLLDERPIAPASDWIVRLESIAAEAPTPPPPERSVRS